MDMQEIKDLIALLEGSKLGKLVVKRGNVEICLEKEQSQVVRSVVPATAPIESAPSVAPPSPKKKEEEGKFVTSPMVGTFYAAPGPDQQPFVKVGDFVQEGTVMCIIEAMKVMNEVKAGMKGKVAEILSHSGQPVEYGSRLFRIVEA